jgi:predicted nucleic acid-binding protein
MTGTKFLLDTNFVIGLSKQSETVVEVLSERAIELADCAYSFITRIELLSYPVITQPEIAAIEYLLSTMRYCSISKEIENTTIRIRRQYRLKTPDAIVAATAITLNLELLTLDRQLANRMQDILGDQRSS